MIIYVSSPSYEYYWIASGKSTCKLYGGWVWHFNDYSMWQVAGHNIDCLWRRRRQQDKAKRGADFADCVDCADATHSVEILSYVNCNYTQKVTTAWERDSVFSDWSRLLRRVTSSPLWLAGSVGAISRVMYIGVAISGTEASMCSLPRITVNLQ